MGGSNLDKISLNSLLR